MTKKHGIVWDTHNIVVKKKKSCFDPLSNGRTRISDCWTILLADYSTFRAAANKAVEASGEFRGMCSLVQVSSFPLKTNQRNEIQKRTFKFRITHVTSVTSKFAPVVNLTLKMSANVILLLPPPVSKSQHLFSYHMF